jgi:hypothetical protein
VWIVFVLVSLNVRLFAYDDELAGLAALTSHMEPGFDVRTMLPETVHDSEVMGQAQLGQAAAWVTAELGGILANDSADYYQMPIRRAPVPFPTFYRYIIAKGDLDDATRKTTAKWPSARLVHTASSWLLFEDPPAGGAGFTVIRSMQSWGSLQQNKSAGETPLSVGGTHFARGLGTHASSFIRIRIDNRGRTFSGACGIDDGAGEKGLVSFRIRDDARETLFESGEVRGGEPARRFSVALAGRTELILEVNAVETIDHGHGDWVDLKVD